MGNVPNITINQLETLYRLNTTLSQIEDVEQFKDIIKTQFIIFCKTQNELSKAKNLLIDAKQALSVSKAVIEKTMYNQARLDAEKDMREVELQSLKSSKFSKYVI